MAGVCGRAFRLFDQEDERTVWETCLKTVVIFSVLFGFSRGTAFAHFTFKLSIYCIVLFCRIGKQFELPLLLQSVVMILTMLVMLHLCCSIQSSNRVSTKQHHITGNHIKQSVSMLFLLVNTTWFNIWLSHTSLKCPIFGGTY